MSKRDSKIKWVFLREDFKNKFYSNWEKLEFRVFEIFEFFTRQKCVWEMQIERVTMLQHKRNMTKF